jgi:hypothetical protein
VQCVIVSLCLTSSRLKAECRVLSDGQTDLAFLAQRSHPMLAALLFTYPKFLVPSDNAIALKALPPVKVLLSFTLECLVQVRI